MTVPPFPPKDLAKLVLGYLAEEQLMTAYDEFLQASPYLDAMKNEYDRIFMTSLRKILAEYRAVKIYVETCKPFSLRKRLFQCTNLLEIVKFLVVHFDVNKLRGQEHDKTCIEQQDTNTQTKLNICETCNLLKLPNCVCKNRLSGLNDSSSNSDLQMSAVEATSLADLPGNKFVTNRKRHVKVLEGCSNSGRFDSNNSECIQPPSKESSSGSNVSCTVQGSDSEKNNTARAAHNDNVVQSPKHMTKNSLPDSNNVSKNVFSASTFQDFAAGVKGDVQSNIVPDSSTSENSCLGIPIQSAGNKIVNVANTKQPILLKVTAIKQQRREVDVESKSVETYRRIRPKIQDPKIKILSDIKVDNYSDQKKIPDVLKNATSTPLMQMQTIVINGTPAYSHEPVAGQRQAFTKDEIMAMPTLIVVPSAVPMSNVKPQTSVAAATTVSNVSNSQAKSDKIVLSPLVIDVTSSPCQDDLNLPDATNDNASNKEINKEPGLIKTVDVLKNTASLPKDNTIACESSTPHVLPVMRKSSSTPRRNNSHIRVLDFTTPRRILHESSSEQDHLQNPGGPVEVILTGSPDIVSPNNNNNNVTVEITSNDADNKSVKENKLVTKPIKKSRKNWDSDLRALVVADISHKSIKSVTLKPKKNKKKKLNSKTIEEAEIINDKIKEANTKKIEPVKEKRSINTDKEEPDVVINNNAMAVKPTIIIKSGTDWVTTEDGKEKDSTENRETVEKSLDTPEVERLSLHNDIGGKLNISDIFETPYKQAFYDIQMETPRFLRLGPDLPDEPMSEIKIMNIPTPLFLDTKPTQTTPSSYSSRPTDYSGGSSYYKPDDQDSIPAPNIFPVTSTKESTTPLPQDTENKNKKSRPVRKCTKNVSYYKKSLQEKEVIEEVEVASNHSDTTSASSGLDKNEKDANITYANDSKLGSNSKTKTLSKKRNSKKSKTPIKKEKPKSFMKIKPRKITPTKETVGGRGRKKLDKTSHTSPAAKRSSNNKEKSSATLTTPSVPTKSRRKSSTPRKLHCNKIFNSESSGQNSPENILEVKSNLNLESRQKVTTKTISQDSDTDQLTLRWSDDGSQDSKSKGVPIKATDIENVTNIQAYIETSVLQKTIPCEPEGSLQNDLLKRGFDPEEAKKIERDLLDTPPHTEDCKALSVKQIENIESKKDEVNSERSVETDNSALQIDETEEEFEFSTHECNDQSDNYFVIQHNIPKYIPQSSPVKLKDSYLMEICLDNEETIKLRSMPFTNLFELEEEEVVMNASYEKETENAVNSISNYDKLYTPLKDSRKAQCYEIFDSTLTSLDTPLKNSSSPRASRNMTVTEIVFEEEKIEVKEPKKRKRLQNSCSSEEAVHEHKRTRTDLRPDPKDLLKSTNIQNFDIETVLTKLHGH